MDIFYVKMWLFIGVVIYFIILFRAVNVIDTDIEKKFSLKSFSSWVDIGIIGVSVCGIGLYYFFKFTSFECSLRSLLTIYIVFDISFVVALICKLNDTLFSFWNKTGIILIVILIHLLFLLPFPFPTNNERDFLENIEYICWIFFIVDEIIPVPRLNLTKNRPISGKLSTDT